MQNKLKLIHDLYVSSNSEALLAAQKRADDVDTSALNLGEGQRKSLLAATGYSSIEELVAGAFVVEKMKRGALVQVGCLLYYSNMYGVMTCMVPAKISLGSFNAVWGPSIMFAGGKEILERLGAADVYDFKKKEYVYDYSACTASQKTALTA